jgi:hypothetical protein
MGQLVPLHRGACINTDAAKVTTVVGLYKLNPVDP